MQETAQLQIKGPQAYALDIDTIEGLDDVKAILDGLGLVCSDTAPRFEQLSRYFTKPVFQD